MFSCFLSFTLPKGSSQKVGLDNGKNREPCHYPYGKPSSRTHYTTSLVRAVRLAAGLYLATGQSLVFHQRPLKIMSVKYCQRKPLRSVHVPTSACLACRPVPACRSKVFKVLPSLLSHLQLVSNSTPLHIANPRKSAQTTTKTCPLQTLASYPPRTPPHSRKPGNPKHPTGRHRVEPSVPSAGPEATPRNFMREVREGKRIWAKRVS